LKSFALFEPCLGHLLVARAAGSFQARRRNSFLRQEEEGRGKDERQVSEMAQDQGDKAMARGSIENKFGLKNAKNLL